MKVGALGPVHAIGMAATGGHFSQFEEGGVTDTGCILATSDEEMEKMDPVPSGCGEKSGHTSLSSSTVGPPQPSDSASSGRIFARNAIHPNSVNRP
jgi:hypothetical protein